LTVKTLARSHKATRRYIRTIVDITSFWKPQSYNTYSSKLFSVKLTSLFHFSSWTFSSVRGNFTLIFMFQCPRKHRTFPSKLFSVLNRFRCTVNQITRLSFQSVIYISRQIKHTDTASICIIDTCWLVGDHFVLRILGLNVWYCYNRCHIVLLRDFGPYGIIFDDVCSLLQIFPSLLTGKLLLVKYC
jgi:hypothetical protein